MNNMDVKDKSKRYGEIMNWVIEFESTDGWGFTKSIDKTNTAPINPYANTRNGRSQSFLILLAHREIVDDLSSSVFTQEYMLDEILIKKGEL